jgi:ketol-acid reductoisomerase
MKQVLRDIQSGEYAKSFILENRAGAPTLLSRRRLTSEHSIEVVGEKLRAMMPWIKANKLVDKSGTEFNRRLAALSEGRREAALAGGR